MYFNTSVANVSPCLSYIPSAQWTEGTTADPNLDKYATGSYHATSNFSATVSLDFFGTGIWIYGGYRQELGPYAVRVDNDSYTSEGFRQGDQEIFQYLLYGQDNMDGGISHHVEVINMSEDPNRDVLTFDYLVFESVLGGDGEVTRIEDYDHRFSYYPQDNTSWSASSSSRTSTNADASVQLEFTGQMIGLYGSVGSDHSTLTAVMDGENTAAYPSNTRSNNTSGSQLLLFIDTLSQTNHTVVIRNDPQGLANLTSPASRLNIDYALVYSKGDVTESTPTYNSVSKSGIIGSSLGAATLLAALLLSLFRFCQLRKKRKAKERELYAPTPFIDQAGSGPTRSRDHNPRQYHHRSVSMSIFKGLRALAIRRTRTNCRGSLTSTITSYGEVLPAYSGQEKGYLQRLGEREPLERSRPSSGLHHNANSPRRNGRIRPLPTPPANYIPADTAQHSPSFTGITTIVPAPMPVRLEPLRRLPSNMHTHMGTQDEASTGIIQEVKGHTMSGRNDPLPPPYASVTKTR